MIISLPENKPSSSPPSKLKRLRRVLYWTFPLLLLGLIFSRIDTGELKQHFRLADMRLVIAGMLYFPLVMIIGAERWRWISTAYPGTTLPRGFALKHYWSGLTVGLIAPATLGWDAYRIIVAGQKSGRYGANIIIVLVEKLMALITTMSLILILFQVLPLAHSAPTLAVVRTAGWILGLTGGLGLALFLTLRHRAAAAWLHWLEEALGRLYSNLLIRLGLRVDAVQQRSTLRELFKPTLKIRVILGLLAFTYLIQVLSAAGNWLFFQAVGYELPFLVNLFVTPILYFVYILPISFGNIGVREGAHIFFYGLFGVPAETALMVSFFGFAGAMLNQAIGGMILLLKGKS